MLASSSFPELDTLGGPLPTNYHQPASAPAFKFIYYEKAPNFCKISTIDLSYVVMAKSTMEILQNILAFSENMNFIYVKWGPSCFKIRQHNVKIK